MNLYNPRFEHDACGIGAVVDVKGRASYGTVDDALKQLIPYFKRKLPVKEV